MSSVQLDPYIAQNVIKWRGLAATDPHRVVRALEATVVGRNKPESTYSVLIAIAQISAGKIENGSCRASWDALVHASIMDKLCQLVIDAKVEGVPSAFQEAARIDSSTPYQLPLEILLSTIVVPNPPTPVDQKAISTLKARWHTITQRLWDEPGLSLSPSEVHANSRTTYARLCVGLLNIDRDTLSQMYSTHDLVIPVISRFWKHSTSHNDTLINTQALERLLQLGSPEHASYVAEHGAPSSEQLLSLVYIGVGLKPTSPRGSQAEAITRTVAKHLTLGGDVARHCLNLLIRLCALALESGDKYLYPALCSSGGLWSNCVGIIRKLPSEPEVLHNDLVNFTLGLMTNVLHSSLRIGLAERASLVRVWAEQGFFDALDKNIDLIITTYAGYKHIAHISVAIDLLMKDESVALALRPRLLAQFPRWRIIGTLVKRDLEAQQVEGYDAPRLPTPGEAVSPQDPVWRQASWQCWAGIENACFDWEICGRRTCGKAGVILCSGCAAAKYCSDGCLSKDKPAHSVACSYMSLIREKPVAEDEERELVSSMDSLS